VEVYSTTSSRLTVAGEGRTNAITGLWRILEFGIITRAQQRNPCIWMSHDLLLLGYEEALVAAFVVHGSSK
jgi:3-deoxy-D-arabino-heptulosonate 7-phosphate (DAHP) synthase class II